PYLIVKSRNYFLPPISAAVPIPSGCRSNRQAPDLTGFSLADVRPTSRDRNPLRAPLSMTDHTSPTGTSTVPSGIASMLLAVAIFSCMDALIKWLSATYPTMEIVFFRSAFAFLPLLLALWRGGRAALRTRRPFVQAGRAALGLVSMFAFFYCFRLMPLADVFG